MHLRIMFRPLPTPVVHALEHVCEVIPKLPDYTDDLE